MLYLADAEMQMNQMDDARPLLEQIETIDPASRCSISTWELFTPMRAAKTMPKRNLRPAIKALAKKRECPLQAGPALSLDGDDGAGENGV